MRSEVRLSNRMSLSRAVVFGAFSGGLYALSFPPPALSWLAWVALVPLLHAARAAPVSRAIALGAVWSVVTFAGTGYSLPLAVAGYYRQPLVLGWLFLAVVTLITAMPWYTLFCVAYSRLSRRYERALPLLAGAAWTTAELLRVRVVGNPWGVAGYSQGEVLTLTQIVDITGVLGLSFLVASANAAIAELVAARRTGRRRAAVVGCASVAAVLASSLAYGWTRLAQFPEAGAAGATIAVVQPNLPTDAVWLPELYGRNLRRYFDATSDVVRASGAEVVVWPETAMTFYLERQPEYRASVMSLIGALGIELVAGGVRWEARPGGARSFYNATYLLKPDGRIGGRYDKRRLLPFAEFFPWWMPDVNRRDFAGVREFTAGSPAPPLSTRFGSAGVLVCNEAFYGHLASERVEEGAQFLLNPANDSWMAVDSYALQAARISQLRAIEQRRPLVRASTSGPSLIVDQTGRVLSEAGTNERATIIGRIRPGQVGTVYQRVGDAFGVSCAIVTLAALILAATRDVPTRSRDQGSRHSA